MHFRTLFWSATCLGSLLCALSPAAAVAQNWPDDMLDKRSIDFGTVARGAIVKTRIAVTNKYVETVHISGVRTLCKCVTASVDKQSLLSNETAYIDVVVDTTMPPANKDTSVVIDFDAPQPAQARVPVKAYVRYDVVLIPGSVNFDGATKGSGSERKVSIAYAGRQTWTIQKIENPTNYLDAKVVEVGRANNNVNYDLFVTLKPNAPPGAFRTQLTLVTDDVASPRFPVLIEGRVDTEFSVSPELVSFGTVTSGQRQTQQLIVRGKRAFKIVRVESERTTAFEIQKKEDEKPLHIIPLTLVAPAEAQVIDETFTVTISTQAEPIKFRVSARISPAPMVVPGQ